MLLLDLALSFAANTLTVLLVILFLRDAAGFLQARLGAALFTSTAGVSLAMLPEGFHLPFELHCGMLVIATPYAALGWCFARSLLEDEFSMGAIEWGFTGFVVLLGLSGFFTYLGYDLPVAGPRELLAVVLPVLVMGHILWVAISGFRDDLVDTRRRIRIWFILFIVTSEIAFFLMHLTGYQVEFGALFYNSVTIVICLCVLLWATRMDAARLFSIAAAETRVPARLQAAHARLVELMETEKVYRDQRLNLAALAAQVGIPEYQLRKLINQTMDFRNFSDFLNHYRIAHASSMLSSPSQAHVSVLEIALEAGYQSVSTFNRAFQSRRGQTPSQYRSARLDA